MEGVAGPLAFAAAFADDGVYKLLQLTPELERTVTSGQTVEIKALAGKPAVLCTHNKTYGLVRVETSNACLLLDPNQKLSAFGDTQAGSIPVVAAVSSHHETAPAAPDVHTLRQLLTTAPYEGDGGEDGVDTMLEATLEPAAPAGDTPLGFTTEELLDKVLCSKAELLEGLQALHAIDIDGRWRLMTWEFEANTMDMVLAQVVAADHPLDAVPVDDCVAALDMLPAVAVRHCLTSRFGEPGADGTARLDAAKVAMLRAEQVLMAPRGGDLLVADFLEEWQDTLPTGIEADMEMVKGNVLLDGDAVRYFPAAALSHDPAVRFQELFAVRERWALDDLLPFIVPLVGATCTKDALLLSYTRSTLLEDGSRLFSKR